MCWSIFKKPNKQITPAKKNTLGEQLKNTQIPTPINVSSPLTISTNNTNVPDIISGNTSSDTSGDNIYLLYRTGYRSQTYEMIINKEKILIKKKKY